MLYLIYIMWLMAAARAWEITQSIDAFCLHIIYLTPALLTIPCLLLPYLLLHFFLDVFTALLLSIFYSFTCLYTVYLSLSLSFFLSISFFASFLLFSLQFPIDEKKYCQILDNIEANIFNKDKSYINKDLVLKDIVDITES